jgi:hypothetical protein
MRRAVKRRISVDIRQDNARPCIDPEVWDRVWDFGVDEVGDEDDPEMPLGDDSMHLDPVDALTEAQQEEEEAEQGIVCSDLTPKEINEIAEAVHQHNQRLIHNERRCDEKRRRVCVRKSRRI